MIKLSDDQITQLMRLSQPLQPPTRIVFMELLAAKLGDRAVVGDGELYRIARETIRDNHLFEAPSPHETAVRPSRRRTA
jgi:hypothetical protein